MRGPFNPLDLQRARDLIDLAERTADPQNDIKIWVSENGYVSIEVTARNMPINDVRVILGAAPLEPDQLDDISRRQAEVDAAAKRNRGMW